MSDESRAEFWTQENNFPDVTPDDWFNNAVSTVTAAGLMEGLYIGGVRHFNPHGVLSRAEIATIISRFVDMDHVAIPAANFSDVPATHWARGAIHLVTELGWMEGSGPIFNPNAPIPRVGFAIVMNLMLERTQADIDSHQMRTWDDNAPGNWFYWHLQIASISAPGVPTMNWEALQRPNAWPGDAFPRI